MLATRKPKAESPMQIKPLSVTTIDWNAFDLFATQSSRKSPKRYLDSNRLTPATVQAFIIGLEYYINGGNDAKPIGLEDAVESLNHIFVTFGITCSEHEAESFKDLHMRKVTRVVEESHRNYMGYLLISGSLKEWRDNVLIGCSESQDIVIRTAFNSIYEWFKAVQLGRLFSGYITRKLKDTSFSLEKK